MKYEKWQAHGNVYLVTTPFDPTPEQVRELVGDADGILEVARRGADEAGLVIWNADGSQAEMSGNGTRIAARWLAREAGVRQVKVLVGERVVVATMLEDDQVEQSMGTVVVGAPEEIDGIAFVPVSVGNPHAVVLGEPEDVRWIGPKLETHPRFPDRTNVQVARLDGPNEITARVWERGVGETASSGTSAVAVAAATHDEGDVVVHFPGGDLRVRLEDGNAWLTGPAVRID